MTVQCANVDSALMAMRGFVCNKNRVVFDDSGSYILNKITGEITWMTDEDGWFIDVWVQPTQLDFTGPE